MVQPAKDWMRNNVSEPLDWARVGSVRPERNVSSPFVIIGRIFCVEHNQMISAFASDRPRSSVQHIHSARASGMTWAGPECPSLGCEP
jgi:hypothetical protein